MKGRGILLGPLLGLLLGAPAAEGAESWERIQVAGECSQRGTTATCLLRLPEREMRDLAVDVPTRDQDVAFRRFHASLGAWRLAAEGIWHAEPASRDHKRIVDTLRGGLIRLELTGSARPPRLAGVTVSVREPEPVQADPGPAPSRAVFPLEDAWFPAAWPVRAEGVRPGDTVRLELPDEVLSRLGGPDHWELRLATPKGQLPWALDIDELPREADLAGARWVPAERPGWLRLSVPDLPKGPPYMGIRLTAPPQPLLRRVSVEGFEEVLWTCAPEPPLPCRIEVDFYINRWPPRELPKIEIEGGEGAPLPPLDVAVWLRTERLVFVWPEQGPVRLLAGNGEVSSPDVVLLEIDPQAESRPWKPVTLGPEERLFRKGYLGGGIAAALVLAGLCLWERRRRLVVPLLLLALPAAPARGEEVVFRSVLRERRVEVPAAGWVRVPLGMETLSSLGPDGRRLRVIGPEGDEIPSRIGLEGEAIVPPRYSLEPVPPAEILAGSPSLPEGRTVPLAADCAPSGASALCSLRLPARGQLLRGLTLELRGAERGVGIRVATAHEGRWQSLAEGVREGPADGKLELRLTPSLLSSELLRLELFGESARPGLLRAEAHLSPASLLFSAPLAGSYRLLYGDGRAAREPSFPGEGEAVREIEPGPERRLPPPPGFAVEPQSSSNQLTIEAAWPVLAPGARTGEVIRLLLPAQIESSGRPSLRLQSGGEEIPYLVRALDEPARETAVRFPAGRGWRYLSLPVARGVAVTGLRLEAGAPVSASIMGWGTAMRNDKWTCRPARRFPCVLDVGSSAADWREGEIRLQVGGEAPELAAMAWRRQRELVFVWPGDSIRLVAGRGAPSTPSYDLLAIEDRLLAQPWKPASLGRGGDVAAAARSPWLRWSLVALAALVLLAVVHVMMPSETQKDRRIAGLPEA